MHTIQIDNDTFQLPQNWDELTNGQLLYLVKLTQSDIPIEELKIYMMLYCLQARVDRHKDIYGYKVRITVGQPSEKVRFQIRKKSYLLRPEEVNALADLFSFLLRLQSNKYHTGTYIVIPELSRNPYPTLRCRLRKFVGPDDQLLDITFEQFMYLQTYLDAMKDDPTQIDHLLACLWHQKETFDINHLECDASILSHLPPAQKMVMYWFVLGSLSQISINYPRVFSGDGKTTGRVFDSQMRLLDSLAQSDMTKKPEVRKGYLIDALYSMDESMRRREESEENIRNS